MSITPRYARQRLHAIKALVDDLCVDVPRAIELNRAQRDQIDGYPSGSSDVTVHTSRGTSSVEHSAMALELLNREADDILEHINALAAVCGDMLDIIRHRAPRLSAEEKAAMLCSGGVNLPGAIVWSDPLCRNVQSPGRRDGLCDKCRMAQSRWRRREREQV